MKIIEGDLVKMAKSGRFQVIVHGCNCWHTMGAGVAKAIRQEFPEAWAADLKTVKGAKEKLGTISVGEAERDGKQILVVNGYTQYHWRGNGEKVDYAAIRKVMALVKQKFTGMSIAYPKIGAGLGGGDWPKIEEIIGQELVNEDHTLVILPRNNI